MPIENTDDIEIDLIADFSPPRSLLTRAIEYVSIHPSAGKVSFDNLAIDQENGVASFNGNIEIENVIVDGRERNLMINNIGFVISGPNRAVYIQLIYLSIDDIRQFEELNGILKEIKYRL